MSRAVIAQLKNLKHTEVQPRADWLSNNRALLLSQIRNTVAPSAPARFDLSGIWSALAIFLPQPFVYNVVRPIAVLLIVTLVGTSGWIATVDASYQSLPGDWLYPAKRAAEKTQVAVASAMGNKKSVAKLHAEFAKRRAVEVKQISRSNDPEIQEKMAEAVSGLKDEIKAAHTQLDEMTAKPAEAALAEVAKDVKQNTETIREALDSAKEKLLISSSTAPALNQELAEVKNMAKDTEVKAMEVLVTQHLAGDKSVTSEEVRQQLQNTLTTAATEIATNKENVSGVKDIVNAAKAEVKDLVKDRTVSATSTQELSDKISNVAAQTKDATAKSEQVTIDAEKNITAGQAAMAQGDLTKALGAVKALAEQTKESEKLKDSVMASAQSVLPAVAVVKDTAISASTTAPVVSSTAPAVANVKK